MIMDNRLLRHFQTPVPQGREPPTGVIDISDLPVPWIRLDFFLRRQALRSANATDRPDLHEIALLLATEQ